MKPNSHSNSERLEQAFDRYYPALFRYFRYRGAEADAANDLASATFERALDNLGSFDPRRSQIQTWLFAIARNLSINHWKAASNHPLAPLDEDMPAPDDPPLEQVVEFTQHREQILSAIQTLDERAREILALKFGGPLTNRQIADRVIFMDAGQIVGYAKIIVMWASLMLRNLATYAATKFPFEEEIVASGNAFSNL